MAAESVVSFVMENLGNLLIQEGKFLYGVSGKVEQMQTELKLMQIFLKEADKRQDEDEMVRAWVSEIREAAYDAEAVIETYFLKVAFRRRGGIQNNFKRYACILGEPMEIHKVGSEIKAITTRISNLRSSLQNYGITPQSDGEGSSSTHSARQNLRRVYSHIVEEYTVGLDGAVKDLVALLVNEEEPRVVSICGMGGLGKTTLAKKICHHNDIRRHFDGFAWASISQQFQPRNIWEMILSQLISPSQGLIEETEGLTDEEVAKRLYKVQQKKKYLVILDDIWRLDDWDSLSAAFPVGKASSKILLTTRNKCVAMFVNSKGFLHEPRCLDEEESWELLQMKAFPDFEIDIEKEKQAKEMVGYCKGLPLAIVVLGGILATKPTWNEWLKVHGNIESYFGRGFSGVSEILALSYHELSYQLKPCFLHLGYFPENLNIPVKKLFKLWVAEGIVSLTQNEVEGEETLEDVAEHYLDELIQRCMVQVGFRGSTGTVKTCHLHDLVRDFCLLKSKQENFLEIVHLPKRKEQVDSLSSMATTTKSICRVRRLAIHLSEESSELFPQQITFPYIQSLLFFARIDTSFSKNMISKFSDFKLLKVLDFDRYEILGKLPRVIGNLVHLRYLSLNCGEIRSIPSSIGNLRFLQTLILKRSGDHAILLPNVIWKMEQLRHLCLEINIRNPEGLLRLGNLINLQTLRGFRTSEVDVNGLTKLTNLRKLRIEECKGLKEFEGILISPNASLNRLRSLSINAYSGIGSEVEETDLQRLFFGCQQLYKLQVMGKIRKLPEYPQFPPYLTKLTLTSSHLKEDPMPTLEKLPNLTILSLFRNAFVGKEMVCSSKGFPQLKSLFLWKMHNLEEWSVSDEAMPTLSKLQIFHCPVLKMIPDGLRFITTLKQLEIVRMPEAFTKRVRAVNGEGGEDSYKVQHVPSIIFIQ